VSHAFLLCRQCGVLHSFGVRSETDDDGLTEFHAAHFGHTLEDAQSLPDPALFDGPVWDPMSTRWFQIAVGAEVLLVRSWRASIDEPRRHELTSVSPSATDCVEIDEPLLRRALDRHFYPHAMRPAKIERFVQTVRELVADLDPAAVDTSFDDASVPNASIGPFPAELCALVLEHCAPFFDAWEIERVRGFVDDHRREDGALAVRVRRILNRSAA